eukprot:4889122-Pyramimonas_sp.AAC.1
MEHGMDEVTMDRRKIPPSCHHLGSLDNVHRARRGKNGLYSPSSFVSDDMQNPHAKHPGYKFQRPKKQVDIAIDMKAAIS